MYLSLIYMHLIASFEAINDLTTLFVSRSTHLIILSQEAVKSILNCGLTLQVEIGSANLKTATHAPVSQSHCLTVQSLDDVIMKDVSVLTMQLILFVCPIRGAMSTLFSLSAESLPLSFS